jgi:hypothetical protein
MYTIHPHGIPSNAWSRPLAPAAWTLAQIPESPGVYRIRTEVVATNHSPSDVIYIGKAICLHCRFWQLVQTWARGNGKHGSWRNNLLFGRRFNPAKVFCQFKRLGGVQWHQPRMKFDSLWPDSFKNTYDSGLAVTLEETSLLVKHRQAHGTLPVLNSRGPDAVGTRLRPYCDLLYQAGFHIVQEFRGR